MPSTRKKHPFDGQFEKNILILTSLDDFRAKSVVRKFNLARQTPSQASQVAIGKLGIPLGENGCAWWEKMEAITTMPRVIPSHIYKIITFVSVRSSV